MKRKFAVISILALAMLLCSCSNSEKIREETDAGTISHALVDTEKTEYQTETEYEPETEEMFDVYETEETAEQTSKVVCEKSYEQDDWDVKIDLYLDDDDENLNLWVDANTDDEERASVLIVLFNDYLKTTSSSISRYTINVDCNELWATYSKTQTMSIFTGVNKDGSTAFSAPDWIVTELTMGEDAYTELANEVSECLKDFANCISEALGN